MLFEPKSVLEGINVRLQKPYATFETADILFRLVKQNRRYLLPWVDMADSNITGSHEEAFLHLVDMTKKWQSQYAFEYLIFESQTNLLIGLIGAYQPFPEHKSIEIGFWIDQKHTHRGMAREALQLVESEFFFLEFERIVVRIDTGNQRACHFIERCNYRLEGTLRHAFWSNQFGTYRDLNIFAKLKSEYK